VTVEFPARGYTDIMGPPGSDDGSAPTRTAWIASTRPHALAQVGQVHQLLTEEVQPHETSGTGRAPPFPGPRGWPPPLAVVAAAASRCTAASTLRGASSSGREAWSKSCQIVRPDVHASRCHRQRARSVDAWRQARGLVEAPRLRQARQLASPAGSVSPDVAGSRPRHFVTTAPARGASGVTRRALCRHNVTAGATCRRPVVTKWRRPPRAPGRLPTTRHRDGRAKRRPEYRSMRPDVCGPGVWWGEPASVGRLAWAAGLGSGSAPLRECTHASNLRGPISSGREAWSKKRAIPRPDVHASRC
jgi:hypothetical protein